MEAFIVTVFWVVSGVGTIVGVAGLVSLIRNADGSH